MTDCMPTRNRTRQKPCNNNNKTQKLIKRYHFVYPGILTHPPLLGLFAHRLQRDRHQPRHDRGSQSRHPSAGPYRCTGARVRRRRCSRDARVAARTRARRRGRLARDVLHADPVRGQRGPQVRRVDEGYRVPADSRLQRRPEARRDGEVLGLLEQEERVLVGGVVDGRGGLEVGRFGEGGVGQFEGLGVGRGHGYVGGEPVEERDAGAVAGDVDVDEHEDGIACGCPDRGGNL